MTLYLTLSVQRFNRFGGFLVFSLEMSQVPCVWFLSLNLLDKKSVCGILEMTE